jgi:hypothetical protein
VLAVALTAVLLKSAAERQADTIKEPPTEVGLVFWPARARLLRGFYEFISVLKRDRLIYADGDGRWSFG